jgi:hypothetical protein
MRLPRSIFRNIRPRKQTCAVQLGMSAKGQKRTPGREVRHASFGECRASLVARCIGTHRDRKENSDGQVGRRMDIRLEQIQPRRSRAKMRQFSARASTPRGSREKQPCYHLRCSRSVASAAIRINPTTPRVECQRCTPSMSALPPKADMCGAATDVCFGP